MLKRFAERKNVKKVIRFCTKSWQPVPTWRCTIIFFAVIGSILLGVGTALIFYAKSIVEIEQRYDDVCVEKGTCKVSITVPGHMKAPIFVYYGLQNYHQNHKRLISSQDSNQLKGKTVDNSTLRTSCSPTITNKEMGVTYAYDGTLLNPDDIAVPCGTLARAVFNDKFQLTSSKGSKSIAIDESDIAWSFDRDIYFNNGPGNWTSTQWLDMEDEHFIVWMRVSTLPTFKKLWGRINQDLEGGRYILTIDNNYNVSGVDAQKSIYLTNGGRIGTKNWLLPLAYIAVGGTCVLISIMFLLSHRLHYKNR
jgi:hypothetical protein